MDDNKIYSQKTMHYIVKLSEFPLRRLPSHHVFWDRDLKDNRMLLSKIQSFIVKVIYKILTAFFLFFIWDITAKLFNTFEMIKIYSIKWCDKQPYYLTTFKEQFFFNWSSLTMIKNCSFLVKDIYSHNFIFDFVFGYKI